MQGLYPHRGGHVVFGGELTVELETPLLNGHPQSKEEKLKSK